MAEQQKYYLVVVGRVLKFETEALILPSTRDLYIVGWTIIGWINVKRAVVMWENTRWVIL